MAKRPTRPADLITATEARELLGVSFPKLTAMMRNGTLPTYEDVLDRRKKLVSRADADSLLRMSRRAA